MARALDQDPLDHPAMTQSLQDRYAPENRCFGCGPANRNGLAIKSFVDGDAVICTWRPQPMHEAFPGVMNGGIIGALLDCHCNWTAAWHLMNVQQLDTPPCTVTAEYTIKMRRPTPTDGEVLLRAEVAETIGTDRARITGTLTGNGRITATCEGLFVAVGEGHPAFHRW